MIMDNNIRCLKTAKEIFPMRPHALTLAFQTEQYNYNMHEHDFFEINIILEGTGFHYIEERRLKVYPGDMFVIPPGVIHGYESIDRIFNVFHLAINKSFFEIYSQELNHLGHFKMLFEIEPCLRANKQNFYMNLDYEYLLQLKNDIAFFDQIGKECSNEADTIRNILTLKLIAFLCSYSIQNFNRMQTGDRKGYFEILKALEFIHNNYSERITIDDLAKLCNISKATFIRKFKNCTNNTPNKYILNYRCKNAQHMLSMGISRTETACCCGFFDVSHMDKVLLKYCVS